VPNSGRRGHHERCHFLIPYLHKFRFVLGAVQRPDQAVDTIAGIAENPTHAPFAQPLPYEVADRFCHHPASCARKKGRVAGNAVARPSSLSAAAAARVAVAPRISHAFLRPLV